MKNQDWWQHSSIVKTKSVFGQDTDAQIAAIGIAISLPPEDECLREWINVTSILKRFERRFIDASPIISFVLLILLSSSFIYCIYLYYFIVA